MKIKIKNFHYSGVINLCNAIYPQRMLISDKFKIKENGEKLVKKQATLEELRQEIILSHGGNLEEGIKPDHENYQKCVAELNELFNLEVEVSISVIPLSVLERFEADENTDLDSVLILAGTYKLPVKEEETKEVEFVAE